MASRNAEKSEKGIAAAKERLQGKGGAIKFHLLDLSTIAGAKESAEAFHRVESRLDIVVCNAGISMAYRNELSKDGYERMFATNHLGHFTFVTNLLGEPVVDDAFGDTRLTRCPDLIENTANTTSSDARIVITSSAGYKMARKLDFASLKEHKEEDGKTIRELPDAFKRYCDSKLANLYFAAELDRRLQARGVKNVFCNSCHPGMITDYSLIRVGHSTPICD